MTRRWKNRMICRAAIPTYMECGNTVICSEVSHNYLGWKEKTIPNFKYTTFRLSSHFLVENGIDYHAIDYSVFENAKSLFNIEKASGFFGWSRKIQTAKNDIMPELHQRSINDLDYISVRYTKLIVYRTNKYLDSLWRFYSKSNAISPRVELIIPGSFLERVKYASQQQDPKDSLVEAVMKRFNLD